MQLCRFLDFAFWSVLFSGKRELQTCYHLWRGSPRFYPSHRAARDYCNVCRLVYLSVFCQGNHDQFLPEIGEIVRQKTAFTDDFGKSLLAFM